MNGEPPTAAYYRRVADDIEQLVRQAQLPNVRSELLELAERFRRMAKRRECETGGG